MRKTLFLLITLGLLLSGYFFLPKFAGEILKNVFREGTSCAVSLANPQLSILSFSASIENVSIVCEDEKEGEGFYSDKIFVQIDASELWHKTLKVSTLLIEGASTKSLVGESAFLRTLKFVLKKPNRDKNSKKARGWHAWVPRVEVVGKKSQPSILFGHRDYYLSAESIVFTAEDPVDSRVTPVVLRANAKEVYLISENINASLGELNLEMQAGGGELKIIETTLTQLGEVVTLRGTIDIRSDQFDISYDGKVLVSQFGKALGGEFEGMMEMKGTVKDSIYSPQIHSSLNYDLQNSKDQACQLKGSIEEIIFQNKGLKLYNAEINSIASIEEISLALGEKVIVQIPKKAIIRAEAHKLNECIPDTAANFIKLLGKGDIDLGLQYSKIEGISDLDVNFSREGSNIFKLGLKKDHDVLDVDSSFSILGLASNISNIDFTFGQDEKINFKKLQITKLPLFVLLDTLELFKVLPTTVVQNVNRSSILDSILNFSGAGTLNFKGIQDSYFEGVGELLNQGKSITEIQLKSDRDLVDFSVQAKGSHKNKLLLKSLKGKVSGELNVSDLLISEIVNLPPKTIEKQPRLSMMGSFSGSTESPVFDGSVTIDTTNYSKLITSQVKVDKEELKATLGNKESSVSGHLEKSFLNPSLKAELSIQNLNLKDAPFFEDFIDEDIGLNGSFKYTGTTNNILDSEANLDLDILLPADWSEFQPKEPIRLTLEKGRIKVQEVLLPLPLSVNGYLDEKLGWSLDLAGDISLNTLAKNLDIMESIQGQVIVNAQVRGEVFSPQIFGLATMRESSFNLVLGNSIVGAEGVNGTIKFLGDQLQIEKVSGEFADGVFSMRGQADNIFSKDLRRISVVSEGKNMKLEPIDGLFIDFNSILSLGTDKGLPTVLRGTVEVEEAVYENSVNLETLIHIVTDFFRKGNPSDRRATAPIESSGILADLHIVSKGGMLLDTNVVQAEFIGDLHLSSDLFNPFVQGRVKVLDGNFKVNQTEFQILSGELLFEDFMLVMDPSISLTSEGSLRNRTGNDTKVFLSLGGSVKNSKLSLTSEGESSSKDLAKQLGVGAAGNQLKLVDEKVANFGFRDLLSPSSDLTLLERVSGLTGFDDVRVETGVAVRTGEFVPQVFASRPLIQDFRATISNELSGDKASGAKIEYRLDDSFSLLTSWRSQAVTEASRIGSGNIGAGFQYRRTFKGFSFLPDSVKSRSLEEAND